MKKILLLFALLSSSLATGSVEQATAALDQGDFAGAATAYEAAIRDGAVNGHVYYNLGIAYARSGKTADAMAAFLAARKYLPRDPDVQANLKSTLASVKDKLDAEVPHGLGRTIAFWLDRFTVKEFAYATAISLGLVSLLFGLAFVVAKLAPLRWVFAIAYLLPTACAGSLMSKAQNEETWGAVASNGTKAYSGPSDKNPAVFELSEGAPVLVGEVVPGGYARVQLSDGKKAWIAKDQLKVY